MKVGIVYRDRIRELFVRNISKRFDVVAFKLPENLPDVLEEEIDFPDELMKCDMIISYAFHGNVNEDLVRKADESGVKLVLIAGGYRYLRELAKKTRVIADDICCSVFVKGFEFFKFFGLPEFEVEVKDGRIVKAEVVRCAPCGVSYEVAKAVVGLKVDEAIRKAGLIVQLHCLAKRDGLHKAGKIHSLALSRALKKYERR